MLCQILEPKTYHSLICDEIVSFNWRLFLHLAPAPAWAGPMQLKLQQYPGALPSTSVCFPIFTLMLPE